jgi:energy-converting hydrogenase Eha subunit A
MAEFALALVAVTTAVALGLSIRRRRFARHAHLSSTLDPMPLTAGVKHLAASVSQLSDLGLHLPAASHAIVHKRRLGVLLGLR